MNSRCLTAAETDLARSVFGCGLDYERIRLHFGTWWLPNNGVAMAPFGRIHFPAAARCTDFAACPLSCRTWLVHELAHVWQYQNGFPVWLGGGLLALSGGYLKRRAYRLPDLAAVPHFSRLNMEGQAEMFALYYRAAVCGETEYAAFLPQLHRLLQPFFDNPTDRRLLPGWL